MNKLKFTILAAFLGMVCLTASAQNSKAEYQPYPYYFLQLQGGVNKVFSPGSKFNPTASFGFGGMFSPVLGARLHFNGYETKNGFDDIDDTYKFRYLTSDVDLMLNVVNIFCKQKRHPIDLYILGGVGLSYAWNRSEYAKLAGPTENILSHNLRAGMLIDANVSKHWSIGLEADVNALDDRFNSKRNGCMDWLFTGQLSLTYKFGFKKASKPVVAPVTTSRDYDTQPKSAAIVNAPAKSTHAAETVKAVAPTPAPITVNETCYYEIRETSAGSQASIVSKVAQWASQNPDKTITVEGYADKGTGTTAVNQRYAKQRAENVAKALKAQGIPESRIKVVSYGDTVQPFADNDKNRCVIIVGK